MSLDELREQFIRPDAEIAALRERERSAEIQATRFPKRDGYYWLQWPDDRVDESGKPHTEPCEVKDGGLFLIHTQYDQRKHHERGYTFSRVYSVADLTKLKEHLKHVLVCAGTPNDCEDCQQAQHATEQPSR